MVMESGVGMGVRMTDSRHREIANKIIPEPFINAQEEIAKALEKLEAETIERVAKHISKLDPLETQSHGWEYGSIEDTVGDVHDRYVEAIRSLNNAKD